MKVSFKMKKKKNQRKREIDRVHREKRKNE